MSKIKPSKRTCKITEAQVCRSCDRHLVKQSIFYLNTNGCSKAGMPDRVLCLNGTFVGIEYKRPVGGVVSNVQRKIGRDIENAGGGWRVVTCLDELKSVLSIYDHDTK